MPLLYLTTVLQGFGALGLILALAGLALAWKGSRPACALLAAFPLAYLAFMLPKPLFFIRFALPLVPFLALFAAVGVVGLTRRAPSAWRRPLVGGLVVLMVGQPLLFDLLHNRLLLETDTRILANEWVQANLPPGSRLRVESYSLLDLSAERKTYTPNRRELKIELFLSAPDDDQLRVFAERDVRYFVSSSFASERFLIEAPTRQDSARRFQRFHRDLEQQAKLLASFGPGPDGQPVPYRHEDLMTPFWSLMEYRRIGPMIRVYALPRIAGRAESRGEDAGVPGGSL